MRTLLLITIGFLGLVTSQIRQPSFLKSNTCPDGKSSCPSTATCCEMEDGSYGCCPMKNAVCCSDHIHCCPSGTTCEVEEGRCARDGEHMPIQKKFSGSKKTLTDEVICPDHRSKCPAETTCCQISMGSYGCCPMPNAVCCSDRMHCCPNGYQCDTTGQRCVGLDEDDEVPMLKKFASTPIVRKKGIAYEATEENEDFSESDEDEGKICGKVRCPSSFTCCASRGLFGEKTFKCCPLSQAVCCDGYCCPLGYQCSKGKTCERKARYEKKSKHFKDF